jgi:hypothetical protein
VQKIIQFKERKKPKGLVCLLDIFYVCISTKEMFALAPKEIMHECNFLLLLCDGKRARQVLYISIVQSGQEKNEKERAFCVRAAFAPRAEYKKEKRRRKILALFAAGVYNHLSCTSDVSVCISDSFFIPPPPSSYRNTKRLNEYIKKKRERKL